DKLTYIQEETMSVYLEKIELYKKYVAELDQIAGRGPMPEGQAKNTAEVYINADYAHWENIWAADGKLAGFLVVCREPECHPDADYFIAQLYVRPEYRRQGYAKKAVLGFLGKHSGKYCKLMIEKNTAAYAFWDAIKAEVHAEDVVLAKFVGTEKDGEKQVGFRIG
ncbi:MAG: GNAT family N-acetyltransferase, partial [Clostridiales bacterium]|nr:GNAT family N-acetyltransferase [Clostridiales bacterium]